jgi:hypothetical protein
MAKHKQKHKKKARYRNNGGGGGAPKPNPAPRSRPRYVPRRGEAPDLWTTAAAALGGAGSAVLSALAVDQGIVSKEVSAVALMGVGGATAYFADGNTRVVGNSMASAGAGQLAYALIDKRKKAKEQERQQAPQQGQPQLAAGQPTPLPASQPAPSQPAPALRKAAYGGGYVIDVYKDAANQLDLLDEDSARMGTRDAADGFDVYDLDDLDAAA